MTCFWVISKALYFLKEETNFAEEGNYSTDFSYKLERDYIYRQNILIQHTDWA